jgi:hypothetical protein
MRGRLILGIGIGVLGCFLILNGGSGIDPILVVSIFEMGIGLEVLGNCGRARISLNKNQSASFSSRA